MGTITGSGSNPGDGVGDFYDCCIATTATADCPGMFSSGGSALMANRILKRSTDTTAQGTEVGS